MSIFNCSLITAICRVVTLSILAIALTTPCISSAVQGARCIVDNDVSSSVSIARSKGRTVVLTETTAPATIHLVARLFVEDLRALVPSVEAIVRNASSLEDAKNSLKQGDQVIIVGLFDQKVQGLVKEALAASKAPPDNIIIQWESWNIYAAQSMNIGDSVHDAIILTASDKRGIAYALFTITEEAGVSPWVWWADVPVQAKEALRVKSCSHGPPAVKYRGIFLNDESPALTGWANKFFHTGAGSEVPLGQSFTADFYAKFFELLLRLKANIFWPAMWSDMFAVAGLSTLPNGGKNGSGAAGPNQRLADLYGIIYGTSHEEPMARNTPEFDRYAWNQQWDFAANAKGLEDWWRYGALRAAPQETLFTVGMRGRHDSPLQGASANLLERIVERQRQILSETQEKPAAATPQSWCVYSEVLKYYESEDLKVPEDVIILWADDNFGNLRRIPSSEKEVNRSGGHGLYYHMDYHGPPRSYQWLSTVNFVKTWEQLNVAQATGINRMLVVNVGDLKPIEVGTELAMSLAYAGTQDVLEQGKAIDKTIKLLPWLERWSQSNFPELQKELVARVVLTYNAINNRLKPEFLLSTSWSLLMEQEAERIQAEWTQIADLVSILRKSISIERHAAFEQLVALPALLSANLNSLYIASGRANLYAKQGRASTGAWHEKVLSHFAADQELTKQYHTLSGGKWDRMMGTPHINYQSWDPPKADSIPNTTSIPLITPNSSLIVSLEGSATAWSAKTTVNCQGECKEPILPPLDRYTYTERWVDVSSTVVGGNISFAASSSDVWLKLSRTEGMLDAGPSADARISISVDWDKILASDMSRMIGSVTISSPQDASSFSVKVPVDVASIDVTQHAGGYIGANGLVAMHAANSTARRAAADGAAWHSLPGYGMTGNAVTTLPPTHASYTASRGPTLTFDFSIIGGMESLVRNGNISITVYVGLIWNYRPNKPHAFTLQLDEGETVTVQPVPIATADGPQPREIYALGPPDIESVLKKGMRLVQMDYSIGTIDIEQAWHTLTLAAVHPGLVIEMIAIGTIPLGLSLPPRQSFRVP